MSSFFSDDEQDDQEQGRAQGQRQEPPTRRGRAAPRLARHLRPTTAATADTASIPALEQDEGNGISFRSDVGDAGSDRRPGFGGLDLGLDEDELFGGAGNVPAEPPGHLLADIGLGGEQEEDEEEETEVKRLTKVWVRERGTPEIMQWEGELVEECLHRLQQQVSSWRASGPNGSERPLLKTSLTHHTGRMSKEEGTVLVLLTRVPGSR
ncbi:hypothetical protein QFC24_003543 [Naganishia onofrii]|uniref:Uncharacterized protein n=1 Tax=Naganishia onofrii TaxID=1851511 RepID=A0ACC2XJZ7_9TREE|nr:hypothetical protein QFC24_003543 [Naganishia onofrii]